MPEKAPRWDLTGTEGCGGGKVFLWLPLLVWEYIGEETRSGRARGAHKGGGTPYPPRRALRPCGRLMAPLTSSPTLLAVFWSKKNHREGFIPFGLRLVFLFREAQKQGKSIN